MKKSAKMEKNIKEVRNLGKTSILKNGEKMEKKYTL